MIVIADSGSTKCDWRLINGDEISSVSTMGLNPFFHDERVIEEILLNELGLLRSAKLVSEVHFYGAGCSSETQNRIVEKGLKRVFVNAKIHVDHDVMGAAIATCQGEPGIACILGTGSNACFYDGQNIHQEIPSLGYILGDEGSGSWYGKQLLRDYLYRDKMPAGLKKDLDGIGLEKDDVLNRIYKVPNANVYIASFSKMLSNHRETEYVSKMVGEGMSTFLERHVCSFSNHKLVPTNFVGSIAYYFQDVLAEEAIKLNINLGKVIKQPIDGLVEFHLK